jgi:hypothetical protein
LKINIYILLFLILTVKAYCQNSIGIGGMGSYNFAIKNFGGGLRLQVPMNSKFAVIPMGSYNTGLIQEMNMGVQAQYYIFNSMLQKSSSLSTYQSNKPSLYLFGSGMYNKWINYIPSLSRAKATNILPLIGLGTSFGGKKIRLFVEAKYNPLFNESFSDFGIMFYPKLGGGSKGTACPSF